MLGAALVWGIAYVSYSVIMGHMGSDAVAANSITTIAKNMLSCLIRGVSGGAGVLIGNLLGAGELDKAKVYGGRLTRMAIVVGMTTAGGDSKFDMKGNLGAMWCFSVPFGFFAAFVLKWPVMVVYCIVNLDEIVKIPAVYLHYKKYIWVRNITVQEDA